LQMLLADCLISQFCLQTRNVFISCCNLCKMVEVLFSFGLE
jgi:hypothetical protein